MDDCAPTRFPGRFRTDSSGGALDFYPEVGTTVCSGQEVFLLVENLDLRSFCALLVRSGPPRSLCVDSGLAPRMGGWGQPSLHACVFSLGSYPSILRIVAELPGFLVGNWGLCSFCAFLARSGSPRSLCVTSCFAPRRTGGVRRSVHTHWVSPRVQMPEI